MWQAEELFKATSVACNGDIEGAEAVLCASPQLNELLNEA